MRYILIILNNKCVISIYVVFVWLAFLSKCAIKPKLMRTANGLVPVFVDSVQR